MAAGRTPWKYTWEITHTPTPAAYPGRREDNMKAVRIGLYADEAKKQAELSLCEAFGMEIYEDEAGIRYAVKDTLKGIPHRKESVMEIAKIPDGWKKIS
jgi:hypothetical protein